MPASRLWLKPTHGVFPIELTLDHCGPMARTIQDVALLLSVIAGPELGLRSLGLLVFVYLALAMVVYLPWRDRRFLPLALQLRGGDLPLRFSSPPRNRQAA